nr:CLDN4-like 5 protein [Scophthalmus maximus]
MVSAGFQILGSALGILGWIGAIIVCALPMWKVTAFIGSNIVTSQTSWEGIWMSFVVQSTGQMQCKVYDSMLALSSDLQAARALTIIAIVVGVLAITALCCRGPVHQLCGGSVIQSQGGALPLGSCFIVAGVLCLVPVCWTAHTIIQNFYNPLMISAQKRELGAALYIGWGAAALMLIGGGMLCLQLPQKGRRGSYTAKVQKPPGLTSQRQHPGKTMSESVYGFHKALFTGTNALVLLAVRADHSGCKLDQKVTPHQSVLKGNKSKKGTHTHGGI